MNLSSLVWAVWAIFAVGGVLGSFAALEVYAVRNGKKENLSTLSETIWRAEEKFPRLKVLVGIGCGLVAVSFAFLIAHFLWQVP